MICNLKIRRVTERLCGTRLRVRLSDTPGLEHPEGLALLEPDIALVACDEHEHHTPLYSFRLKRKIP